MVSPPSIAAGHPRRRLLRYLVGGGVATLACLGQRSLASDSPDLEELCTSFPQNSRCVDYLPGVPALDGEGTPIAVDQFLAGRASGERVAVQGEGAKYPTYLVIDSGPEIAAYAIQPVCPHLGCTVDWEPSSQQFLCPCHGSRFDPQGRRLQGPAATALPLIKVVVKQNQIRLVDRPPSPDPR
jgi:cytochrome b6-f complex iron-sulfur subunit